MIFSSWIDYVMVTLAIMCICTIVGDIIVLVKQKVYKTWSTTSIILSCCMLLLQRSFSLSFFVYAQDKNLSAELLILLKTLLYENTGYFSINISLAMLRQWWRISSLLKNGPDSTKDQISSSNQDKRLICMQFGLLFLWIADIVLILIQCKYGITVLIQTEGLGTKKIIQVDQVWITIRIVLGAIRWIMYTVLITMSFIILYRIIKALDSDKNYQPLKKQVYCFFAIYILQEMIGLAMKIWFRWDNWFENQSYENYINDVS